MKGVAEQCVEARLMKYCLNSCGKVARIYSRRGNVEATDKRKSCGLMWPRKKPAVTHAAGLSGNGFQM